MNNPLNAISTDPVTSQGLFSGALSWVSKLFLPGFLATMATGWLSERLGDRIPEPIRPIFNFFAGLFNRVQDMIRGAVAGEELAAQRGMEREINNNPIFATVESQLGTPGLANNLRELLTGRARSDTGFNMSDDSSTVLTSAIELNTAITDRIVQALKDKNPNWTQQDDARFRQTAGEIASRISGVPTGVDSAQINAISLSSGYAGMLLNVQRGVAQEGKYQESQVESLNISADVAAAARAAAPRDTTTAPESAANTAAPSTSNGVAR